MPFSGDHEKVNEAIIACGEFLAPIYIADHNRWPSENPNRRIEVARVRGYFQFVMLFRFYWFQVNTPTGVAI